MLITNLNAHIADGGAVVLPDERLMTWSFDGPIYLWDTRKYKRLGTLVGHTDAVVGGRLSPKGEWISWGRDGTIRIWSISGLSKDCSIEAKCVLAAGSMPISGVATAADGKIWSWTQDSVVRQ
jgi:WD40 repeat protein